MAEPELITKQDVVLAIANILLRLGKNDFDGATRQFDFARARFDDWLRERPEKDVVAHLKAQRQEARR